MSARIDEYHGPDATPLTTAEVEGWKANLDRNRCARGEPLEGEVMIEFDRILATTRALETAQKELLRVHDALHRECSGDTDLPGEIRALRARLEKAERERDEARNELSELALAVGYGERPEGQSHIIHADGKTLAGAWLLERKGRDQAEADRDIARATVAELVTALEACTEWMGYNVQADGWGCRDRRADADRIETLKTANAALDKAKAVTP